MRARPQAAVPPQPTGKVVEHGRKQSALLQALLWFAPAWGVLLVLLSFVLPVVTVLSGYDGVQPQVSLVQDYGLAGALPAVASLFAAVLTAWLLRFGRRAPSRASLIWAECVAGPMILIGLLAPVVFRRVGLLLVPLAASLLVAIVISEELRRSGQRR